MGQPVINVVKVCEVIVEEFWRAGEENTVKQLREEMLKTLYESIQTGKASGDLVGVWRRMWVLGPNLNNGKGGVPRVCSLGSLDCAKICPFPKKP